MGSTWKPKIHVQLRFGDHNRVAQELEHASKRLAFRLTQASGGKDIQGIEQLYFRADEAAPAAGGVQASKAARNLGINFTSGKRVFWTVR